MDVINEFIVNLYLSLRVYVKYQDYLKLIQNNPQLVVVYAQDHQYRQIAPVLREVAARN